MNYTGKSLKMQENKKIEKLLYYFIILCAVLDLLSSKLYIGSVSITSIIRIIIPGILLLYIFFKIPKERKTIIILAVIYLAYGIIHLILYKQNHTAFSYGNVIYEAKYIINYTYLIVLLYVYLILLKNKKSNKKIIEALYIHNGIYIGSIILSILTNTFSSTYIQGYGNKGWFHTGGSVSTVLVLSLFILLPILLKNTKKIVLKIVYLVITYAYLLFSLGTRVAFYGAILSLICYIIFLFFVFIVNIKKETIKKIVMPTVLLIITVLSINLFDSETEKKTEYLEGLDGVNPVIETSEKIYMAYDFIILKEKIENNELEDGYMSDEQKQAIYSLDEYTKKNKFESTDLRGQQLLYHRYLYNNQNNLILKLFGNGYLQNMGALTLEMETIAIFYNFGILGFILYVMPIICLSIYFTIMLFKNIKRVNIEYLMLLCASYLALAISTFSGHTYFNPSVMIIIVVIYVLLMEEYKNIKKIKGVKK